MAQPTGLTELGSPVSVSVIDGETLRNAAPQINLSENLGSVPGLQIQNRQNYAQDLQMSIRGFGSRSMFGVRGVRMYVDGIPATMPDGRSNLNIDINSVERIEVLRGPYSALYGNASGGVINVDTQTGAQPPTLEAGGYFGSDNTALRGESDRRHRRRHPCRRRQLRYFRHPIHHSGLSRSQRRAEKPR